LTGLSLWLIESFISMDANVLRLLQAVVISVLVVWAPEAIGVAKRHASCQTAPLSKRSNGL